MSNQGLRQASVRAVTGTTGTYQDDWHALFTSAGIAAGDFNGRLLAWINDYLGTTIANVNDAMQAFAVDQGFASWSSMGTFDAGGFEGILDTLATTAAGAWSVARRLTADYEGDLIRLRRVSDNAESDFGYDGDGVLDTAAIATWIGGSSGTLAKIYDQSGNARDMVQATAGNQPAYKASAMNGAPGFTGTNSGPKRLTCTNAAFDDIKDTGMTVALAVHPTNYTSRTIIYKGSAYSTGWGLEGLGSGDFYLRGTGSPSYSPNPDPTTINVDNAFAISYNGLAQANSLVYRLNGSSLTLVKGGGSTTPLASDAGQPLYFNLNIDGDFCEMIVFAAVLSSGDLQALNDDQTSFYV